MSKLDKGCDLRIGDLVIASETSAIYYLDIEKLYAEKKIGLIIKTLVVDWKKTPQWFLVHWQSIGITKWHDKDEIINIDNL